ncbi:glycosyltransferase family 2 protein [Clostridium gasigenes]|uniref:Glycosyl transferase family 2 n=1 Tax=Clostridium gasigenes TaxID=94869 RepID=A0A1H0RZZ5_9CLOT|nr:glycosyltransferase family 2 protein [Clostridium gasigenes]MBU3103819.1 glycosyltransferase family 2 protein [Clostridium gasigenes]MBU3108229.1 glycosyltransferase family 2 protein [Clostridium gasigenes]MBU3132840.1 glycosyltransferase family 2 protein [Clostridium gasigenes]MBU3136608.1 glycosyltransferase family 2 protein [Clostridium gasigenes]SDP34528.1 Glycosyl transferase family 2 [Clostridium gasigenes]
MISISLCIIVKDEETVLGRCLASVRDAVDEIIIIDTGCTDNSISIAKAFGAEIHKFTWIDDFAKARNYAFSHATKDYILWLDADDYITRDTLANLIKLKETLANDVDSVTMHYILSQDSNGNTTNSLRRNRLVKRSNNFKWIGVIHEYLDVSGNIINSGLSVIHGKLKSSIGRNLKIYESIIAKGEILSTRDMFYYANELFDNNRIDESIVQYKAFLDTNLGWVEDNKNACSNLVDCFNYKNDTENVFKYIFKSFEYDVPRADFCCQLGFKFLSLEKFNQSIFWYELATTLKPDENNLGFTNHASSTWLPHLQLCVCYSRIGKLNIANDHNEEAAKYIPDSPKIIHNRNYLKDKI